MSFLLNCLSKLFISLYYTFLFRFLSFIFNVVGAIGWRSLCVTSSMSTGSSSQLGAKQTWGQGRGRGQGEGVGRSGTCK